ncbi:MAG: 1-acyl-sn-glycerol-3-phosphate acyltransferase [Bacteroidales bacterium]
MNFKQTSKIMENKQDFDDIRPYNDDEVHSVFQRLTKEPKFQKVVQKFFPDVDYSVIEQQLLSLHSKDEFQSKIMLEVVRRGFCNSSNGVTPVGLNRLSDDQEYSFISNHRDIVLDASILSYVLGSNGRKTAQIAIGDNLLIYPWIEDVVKLNKNFIVRRGVGVRQMLEVSKKLSEYIRYTRTVSNESIWIAQREGRAKDSNDRTQEALLKMLNLSAKSNNLIENFKELNISPLSLSYEYDPCDYLKAKEFQLKRDNKEYKKAEEDDLTNMETGINGFKGHIYFTFAPSINQDLDALPQDLDKADTLTAVADIIDQVIHKNYHLFPHNYVALDLLNGESTYSTHYSNEEKNNFIEYVEKQVAKIDIANRDDEYLKQKIFEMYANPARNQIAARQR